MVVINIPLWARKNFKLQDLNPSRCDSDNQVSWISELQTCK